MGSDCGRDALDNFLLQHEMQVLDRMSVFYHVEQNSGGNIVWQVADDAQFVRRKIFLPEAGEIEIKYILIVYAELFTSLKRFKAGYDIAVELNDIDPG